eukprot:CAMPEP_0117557206 /NCGR_PEP_ID=MMETSP0784-20121206/52207_1 /TAXON_ID=39447 /ORGANISM="" /LENGTH=206 /DNA_ID=CAMNT_0005354509 /DNA_START=974 /DNA_END=1594 /DNA_ORIENTATION=+
MWSLYLSLSGGISWQEIADPLLVIHPGVCCLFVAYITFSGFVVLNIITAVFVQNANTMNMRDEEHMILEELESRKMWLEEVQCLFEAADTSGTGELSWAEFDALFHDSKVLAQFRKLGIDVVYANVKGLFTLLNTDGSGKVGISELASSMLMVSGPARSIDMVYLRHELKQIRKLLYPATGAPMRLRVSRPRKVSKESHGPALVEM